MSRATGPLRGEHGWVTDWVAWHDAYDDPTSSLHRRLGVVRRRFAEALAARAGRPTRILDLCAGDGRDVIPVLAAHQGSREVTAVLVERDPVIAARAAAAARAAHLDGVDVRRADAAVPAAYADAFPADVLFLCGIFGNVDDADVRTLIAAVPALVVPGGVVIWTRGGSDPDLRPVIRRWFTEAGFDEVSFDGMPGPEGVGVARVPAASEGPAPPLPERLFRFRR